ncbi:hypothetical protein CYMTET_12080 [Cymbomonas tetramitiformis]|uniref:Uncharacterized protein n=1 Tax=Cymbomonas tetramitiformis TaxID=36881 RepID=A0AAE0GLD3_9CHLO|nr:hypothetical protein CYMTET_12080 [Cymbomonas tetramitiformis]
MCATHYLFFTDGVPGNEDDGPEAFACAASAYGPPAVLSAGGTVGGIDVSAYGFSVVPQTPDDSADDDILRRLGVLTAEAARRRGRFRQVVPRHWLPPCRPLVSLLFRKGICPCAMSAPHLSPPRTDDTGGEFGGCIATVEYAGAAEDTGYDTDDWEDLPDGQCVLRRSALTAAANHAAVPAAGSEPVTRSYGPIDLQRDSWLEMDAHRPLAILEVAPSGVLHFHA